MKSKIIVLSALFALLSCQKDKVISDELRLTQDSLQFFKTAFKAANYFSIEDNQNARNQFTDVSVEQAMQKVQFDLQQLNKHEGGNPLIPIVKTDERFVMNKAAVLNHKWIIMDYIIKDEDDSMVEIGEMLIEYTFHANRPCEFFVLSRTTYE